MTVRYDRREIAPLLGAYFPTMDAASTSDDWNALLNSFTGLDIDKREDNASAFDKWRQALAALGVPVWTYTAEQIADMSHRGEQMKALEEARAANEVVDLAALNVEAPTVSAAAIIAAYKKKIEDAAA